VPQRCRITQGFKEQLNLIKHKACQKCLMARGGAGVDRECSGRAAGGLEGSGSRLGGSDKPCYSWHQRETAAQFCEGAAA